MVGRSRRKRQSKKPLLGSHQRCWLWGRHLVLETLKAGKWPIYELRVAFELSKDERQLAYNYVKDRGVDFVVETYDALTNRSGSRDHQGYLAKMPPYPYDTFEALENDGPACPLFLVLDGVQDPYNFGAMLRSAEILGTDAVVIGLRNQTAVTSQAARSSAGAVNYLKIIREENLQNVLTSWMTRGVKIVGASEKAAVPLHQVDFTGPVALVIGNEGAGISPEILSQCDQVAAIPQSGRVGSLNAAVSAGILLYEVKRQRQLAQQGE